MIRYGIVLNRSAWGGASSPITNGKIPVLAAGAGIQIGENTESNTVSIRSTVGLLGAVPTHHYVGYYIRYGTILGDVPIDEKGTLEVIPVSDVQSAITRGYESAGSEEEKDRIWAVVVPVDSVKELRIEPCEGRSIISKAQFEQKHG